MIEGSKKHAASASRRWCSWLARVWVAGLAAACKYEPDDAQEAAMNAIVSAVQHSVELASNRAGPVIHLGACLIDLNGDSTLDVAGISSPDFNTGHAVVLDGRNGTVLWRSEARYMFGAMLFCPTTDTFIVNDKNSFDVSVYTVKELNAPKLVRLDDEPMKFGLGQGCMAAATKSNRVHGFSLADGSAVQCTVPAMLHTSEWTTDYAHGRNNPDFSGIVWHQKLDGTSYLVRAREPGTPVLTVRARGQLSWSAELPYQNRLPLAVLTDDLLVLEGEPVSSHDRTHYLVALDRRTGHLRYQRPLCSRGGGVTAMRRNGPSILVVDSWSGLWSIDTKTGQVLWQAGGCR